ncbi:MAG: hypothetical protein ABI382_09745 [Nakamurella sp.]
MTDPGSIPLRPLTVGDLFGVGLRVVRRHIALLGPIAIIIAVVSAAVELVILSNTGTIQAVATGTWLDDLSKALTSGSTAGIPTGIYLSTLASTFVTLAGALFLSAVVAACVSVDAVGPAPVGGGRVATVSDRLRGRIGPAAIVSVITAIAILAGSFLLIVPGVLAYTVWAAAAPVAVMEGASPAVAFARSARLTRGHRMRILGVTLLIVIIVVVIEAVISAVVVALIPSLSPVAVLVVGDIVTALVSAVTMSWVGAVIALLYVDIRLRTENLGATLRAYAQQPPQQY